MRRSALAILWLPLFAATLHVASLPGWVWGPLAFFALLPRIAWWERGGPWWGDALGGFLWTLLTFSFISHTSWLMPVGMAFVFWPWWLGSRFLYLRLRRFCVPSLAAPLAVGAVEYFRGVWPMAGVPWGSLALGQAGQPGGLFLAGTLGEGGLVVLVLFTGGWLYALARRRSSFELALAPVLWISALGFAALNPAPAEALGTVRCVAIQPNLAIDAKVGGRWDVLEANLQLMRAAWQETGDLPELILWAETMYPFEMVATDAHGLIRRPLRGLDDLGEETAGEALEAQRMIIGAITTWVRPGGYFITGSHLYQGIPEDSPPEAISPRTTGMIAFNTEAEMAAYRAKSRLVPFGETLPFEGALPGSRAVAKWIFDVFGLHPLIERQPPSGPLELPWEHEGPMVLGSAVCWENPYESVFRAQAAQGAQAFCVLSNEAWFGLGAEMDQMLAMTRFRAVETGRPILRVTNTGETVLVGADGSLHDALERGVRGWLAVDLPRLAGDHETAFMRGGWLLLPLAAWMALMLAAFSYLPIRPGLDRFPARG